MVVPRDIWEHGTQAKNDMLYATLGGNLGDEGSSTGYKP